MKRHNGVDLDAARSPRGKACSGSGASTVRRVSVLGIERDGIVPADQYGRRVAIALALGSVDQARAVLDEAAAVLQREQVPTGDLRELPLASTQLDARTVNKLETAGVCTVADLAAADLESLRVRLGNFGPAAVTACQTELRRLGVGR